MTAPFAFVPRAVSKYTKEWQGISRHPPSPSPPPDDSDTTDDGEHVDEHDTKGKEKAVEPAQRKPSTITQDIASLISLALSDYSIWLDPDLRWKLDACVQDDIAPDDAGFVPINYLLRRAPSLPSDHTKPSETEVVKALRAHASRTLEVRMHLPSSSSTSAAATPASSVWHSTGKTSRKKDVGGYEVRRKDWETLCHRPSRGWTRARWDDMTAYMECIPPQYRTVGGIARFAESLLSEPGAVEESRFRVQHVALPPHYLDKPGDAPKCKGFALVTFSTKPDLEAVLYAWPWRRRVPLPTHDNDDNEEGVPPVVKEAHKYGLRAISKARWDALNEEYLVYKQSLVDQIARAETEMQRTVQDAPSYDERSASPPSHTRPETQTQTTPSSPYPFGCLVFVRNVHPDTNKTMLKSLFARAFQDLDQGHDRARTAGVDYVDFTKGTDTCHLRLASPAHATRLLAHFAAQPTSQAHGLDGTGRPAHADDKPIAMEPVRGTKEELYWDKIPEKVRRQAVDAVVQAELAGGSVEAVPESFGSESGPGSAARRNGASGSKRKKRAREC